MRQAAIRTSEMKMQEAMTELKLKYDFYRRNPNEHPMYRKEWYIFYLRTLSNLIEGNFNGMKHHHFTTLFLWQTTI